MVVFFKKKEIAIEPTRQKISNIYLCDILMHGLKKISLIKIFKILCFKDVLKSVALSRSQKSTECIDNYPDTDQRRRYEFKSTGSNFKKMLKDTKILLIRAVVRI